MVKDQCNLAGLKAWCGRYDRRLTPLFRADGTVKVRVAQREVSIHMMGRGHLRI